MEYEPKKLLNQPLVLVLAEFRFSEVLDMASYIPRVQDRLRKQFPLTEAMEQQTVKVSPTGMQVGTTKEWLFKSADVRSAVIIGESRLMFMTAKYDRFPGFEDSCLEVLAVLNEIVEPSLLMRVGLRYSDYIAPIDLPLQSTELEKCVHPQLLPNMNFNSLGGSMNHHVTETSVNTDIGVLLIRSRCGVHTKVVLPDLASRLPIVLDTIVNEEQVAMVLDFDHFWTSDSTESPFTMERSKQLLNSLHEGSRHAFWKATTDYGRDEVWS